MGEPLFLNTGTTLEVFRTEGKVPVTKDLLIKKDRGSEMSGLISFRILTGMLLGSHDFEVIWLLLYCK